MLRNAGEKPNLRNNEKAIVSVRHGPTQDASDKVLNDNKNIATRVVKQQNRNSTSQVRNPLTKKRNKPTTMAGY